MVFIMRSRLILLIATIWTFRPVSAAAAVDSGVSEDYFEFLTRANHYSPLEHAGSHGTVGIGLGVGLASYQRPEDSSIMREHWRGVDQSVDAGDDDPDRILVQRLHLHKGLPLSLDVGVGIGRDSKTNASLYSGYVQWTAYEGFAMPAIAVRAGYNRLLTLATTDVSSFVGEGLVSYGFMRLFTVYGSMGIGRHAVTVRSGPEFGTSMALSDSEDGTAVEVRVRRSRSLGFQVQLLPPFITAAFEGASIGGDPTSYLAKVSLGM